MADRKEERYIATLRTKSLRIAELKTELKIVRHYLSAVAFDTDTLRTSPTGFASTPEQIITHADKVYDGTDDAPDNVTPLRGDHDGND